MAAVIPTEIDDLVIREPFANLFPLDDLDGMAKDMAARGFAEEHPVLAWAVDGCLVLVDGHRRVAAALKAGLSAVPVYPRRFAGEREALEFAIQEQRDRRNLSPKELQRFVVAATERLDATKAERAENEGKGAGRPPAEGNRGSRDPRFSTAETTAKLVGTSPATVKRIRAVNDSGDEETKKAMDTGEISVNAAYRRVKKTKPAQETKEKEEPVPAGKPVHARRSLRLKRGRHPSEGIRLAREAISKLSEIREDDTEKTQAFEAVRRWLDAHDPQG